MAKKQTSRIGASFMALALAVTSTFCMGTFAVSAANTDAQPSESGSATAVLNNEAGWTTCNVYYWGNGGNVSNKSWPGVTLTDADKNADGFYEVEIDAQYLTETNGVIFNNGSEQSADLDIAAGECKVYNNKTKTWEDYDTSALKLSLSTDVASPQYNGTEIVLTATASGGSGSYTYTFKAGSTTIYTGSNNTCTWTPTTAGTYTVSVSVADTEGNTNEKSTSYVIKDDTNAAEPVLKGISTGYTDNKVPVNTSIPINVNASGGKTGTNLLFYKVAVTDPSGNAVNTVYYKQSNILNFTPTTTGSYTVDVTVQASDNKTVNKKYTVEVQTSSTTTPVISSFTASPTSTTVGTATTLKTVVKSGTGTANFTYTYYANSTVIATKTSSSRTST
ncbi:MAG: starch-binding protein, partial [Acutalibacteraceae bacterium]|nr:starch-binding protein [Acutalibacteraceae bacterium]